MDDYDEYYREPSKFEEAALTMRETMYNLVRDDLKEEMDKLRSRNSELEAKFKNLNNLENEASSKKREAERALANAERKVKYSKAKDILREIAETKYMLVDRSFVKEKCNNCDENRKIAFTFPSGKQGQEACVTCGSATYKYIVTEAVGVSVSMGNGDLRIWYKPFKSWDDEEYGSMSGEVKKLYNGQNYAELEKSRYTTIFASKDKAQEFADYLNEKTT